MRREAVNSIAFGTNVPVTGAISGIPSHGRIMFLDFVRQIHDTPHDSRLGSEATVQKRPRFFFALKKLPPNKRGGVPDVIYRGGVEGGIPEA